MADNNFGFTEVIPEGVSIQANIDEVIVYKQTHTAEETLEWFRNLVRAGQPWNFKALNIETRPEGTSSIYEDFGNLVYGSVAKVKSGFNLKILSTLLLPFLLAGCMCLPVARGDLSVLNNDVFSDIIKASYSEEHAETAKIEQEFVNGLNIFRANRLSRDIFIGKDIHNIILLFEQQKGECHAKIENKHLIECSIDKQWRLENIGASFDTSNWSNPAVKMQFDFEVDENKHIQSLMLKLINITQYKKIY